MQFVSLPNILVVHPSLPVHTVRELIDYANEKGGLDFGSIGNGSSSHLTGELLRIKSGAPLNHIPYRDAAQAITALLAGEVPMLFYAAASVLPHLQSGRLRALAVASATRSPQAPDVPTMEEAGQPDLTREPWIGMFAPAQTPPAIVQRLYEAGSRAISQPEVAAKLREQGFAVTPRDPDAFRAFVADEIAQWSEVIRDANIPKG
jgi:tripartite-type tricarboxylate transporter receptor subunit TctC